MQVVAIAAALASGVGMALVNLVFGRLITLITAYTTGASSDEAFRRDASRLPTLLTLAAFRLTRNIRHAYVKARLTQEAAFFDAGSGVAIATQALSNGRSIQTGISEKLGLVFQSGSTCISAAGLAFATQWNLTLICSWIAPATLLVMGVTAGLDASIETRVLKLQAQAGSWAHSMLGSPRTLHAFGLRSRLLRELDTLLRQARQLGHRRSPVYGIMFAGGYPIAHAGFALCFWQGVEECTRRRILTRGSPISFMALFLLMLYSKYCTISVFEVEGILLLGLAEVE
ncbi:uncharacterized protein BO95DRAFT_492400 [Aspergillus brunneoviolaceus CBS 621.78]|uniref:Uncharacterized protein n=1 Tax=Aspergillus brunneoviolaceus CBS 621.78 TaxID=1450534 RepID=A0ACD1GPK5_9EURO|nr:hypothetical protein BO95DRAFT_492400 [Aspergillus brunneoviolaceus CBS 621.78]RAH51186.1 hypothetical protein BO95DRAFT_492400 [Aspergillus brunneoviolaceus CBS 621.78]